MTGWKDPSQRRRIGKARSLLSRSKSISSRYYGESLSRNTPELEFVTNVDSDPLTTSSQSKALSKQLKSDGALCIYGILALCVSLNLIALAATLQSANLIILACLISPFGIWVFFRNWNRWLGSAPYCYRLLTSLGENADNLLKAFQQRRQDRLILSQLDKQQDLPAPHKLSGVRVDEFLDL